MIVKQDLDKLLSASFIVPVEEARWVLQIVVVPKNNNKLRIYVDFWCCNGSTAAIFLHNIMQIKNLILFFFFISNPDYHHQLPRVYLLIPWPWWFLIHWYGIILKKLKMERFQMDGSQSSGNLWTGFKQGITFNDTLQYSRWEPAWNLGRSHLFSSARPTLAGTSWILNFLLTSNDICPEQKLKYLGKAPINSIKKWLKLNMGKLMSLWVYRMW